MVTATLVKDLRDQTNCPMLDCKQALVDANGDTEIAKKLLRERLGSLDTTKTDSGLEGLIVGHLSAYRYDGDWVDYTLFEIGTETDFASTSPKVIEACQQIVESPDSEDYFIKELRSITGENIIIRNRKALHFPGRDGVMYIHHNRKSAAVVIFSHADDKSIDDDLKKSIAMHVVATTPVPVGITTNDIPLAMVEAEKVYLTEKAIKSGKPQTIQDKIIDGGLSKFKASLALLEQPFIKDPSKKVKDILPEGIRIVHISRMAI